MLVRRDYKTNLSNQCAIMLQSFRYSEMSQIVEDNVVRHNTIVISCSWPVTLALKFTRFEPILTNYNMILG